jgi:hypothetical protein
MTTATGPVTAVRVIGIYATKWRFTGPDSAVLQHETLDLGPLTDAYELFQEHLPKPLAREVVEAATVRFDRAMPAGAALERVASWLFALPSDQMVAAITFDVEIRPDARTDPGRRLAEVVDGVLDSCLRDGIRIGGHGLEEYVSALAAGSSKKASPGEKAVLLQERHQVVFMDDGAPLSPADIDRMLYRDDPPYRKEFVRGVEAEGLHEQDRSQIGIITPYVSLICGHADFVQQSVFFSTVQTLGTAARFRQIWHEAYHRVREFRKNNQHQETGTQQRRELEELVDALGNLEFDLTFSVEFPQIRIASFHTALTEALDLEKQATTLSQMFRQLGGSVRSELTAIDIRDRAKEEAKERLEEATQRQYELAATVLTVLVIPVGLVIGFLGINAVEVSDKASMFDLHVYWPAYLAALGVGLVPVGLVAWLRHRARRQAHAEQAVQPGTA